MAKFLRLCILSFVVLASGLVTASLAAARPATKLVRYRGYSITVPAVWPVFDLGSHPTVCVRFDRHAVYLGVPSAMQRCPAHAVGRTEAILLSPLLAHGSRSAHPGGGPVLAAVSTPGAQRERGSSARLAIPALGIAVTATWGRDPGVVEHALHSRSLGSRGAPAGRRGHAAGGSGGGTPGPGAGRAGAGGAGAVFTGLGFDACSAPSSSQMAAWRASPYRAVGVYIGGTNVGCSQPNLTSAWVSAEAAAGWHLIPTYVGLQAPTSSCGCSTIAPHQAASEGAAAAVDAVTQAQAIGIGAGNPIYFDMEAYTPGSTSTNAVLTFLSAWTTQLHAQGYVSGVYSSGASGIADLAAAYGSGYLEPDELWIADWNGRQTTSDPYVPASEWALHQRLHQYDGAHNETYRGVTINIDGDYLDGQTAGTWTPPPDGTFIQQTGAAPIYRLAGGAPLFVSDWTAVGGVQPYTVLSAAQFYSLRPFPADGTFLQTSTGGLYRVAGGAPMWVTSWSVFGAPQPSVAIDEWDIDNITNPLAHLRPVPANGTFLATPTGQVYRVAGGTPFPIASWTPYGGVHPSVVIDPWDLQNLSNPQSHLLATPVDGTAVEGLPSRTYWLFKAGKRQPMNPIPGAIQVDDSGLTPFPALPAPVVCVVPRLSHLTLGQAKRALRRSQCRLGRLSRASRSNSHPPRVIKQSPRPHTKHRIGYPVRVTLG